MNRHDLMMHPDIDMAIHAAARRVVRRYRRYILVEDLVQEGYLWVGQHPRATEAKLPDPDGTEKEHRAAFGRLVNMLERALEGVARAEKAAASGYDPRDEAFYEIALIEELLPALWDESVLHDPPRRDVETQVTENRDPAVAPTWPAMVADIHRAWKLADLTQDERNLLSLRYGTGLTVEQVAKATDSSKDTVIRHMKVAKQKLGRALHGVRPLYAAPEADD